MLIKTIKLLFVVSNCENSIFILIFILAAHGTAQPKYQLKNILYLYALPTYIHTCNCNTTCGQLFKICVPLSHLPTLRYFSLLFETSPSY